MTNRNFRITFVISSMGAGGAERVMSVIANAFAKKNDWDVSLLTLDGTLHSFYPLDKDIHFKPLSLYKDSPNAIAAAFNNLKRLTKLRSAIKATTPDLILSFIDRTNILVLLSSMDIAPIVVSERIHPERHRIGKVWEFLRKQTYPEAVVVAQVRDVADWIRENLNVESAIIPNPIDTTRIRMKDNTRRHRIIASGRLVEQKGFDQLIEAFFLASKNHPEWTLSIYGEGPLHALLNENVLKFGLQSRVVFEGLTTQMFDELASSDIFALSSRYEGFPNVLLEAMATGLACVAFDCPSGPKDMIDNGINGYLIPDGNIDQFARALERLMNDERECQYLGKNALGSTEMYKVDKNVQQWESLFRQIIFFDRVRRDSIEGYVSVH